MSKYDVLGEYLEGCGKEKVRLTFDTIEEILGFELPMSAHKYPAWWENQKVPGHPYCQAWLSVGYKVSAINQTDKWVEFSKE